MTCERGDQGFTLVEVIVVLAVVSVIAGASIPLVSAMVDAERRHDVEKELTAIATALEDYYFDHAAFPPSLRSADFYAVYLQPGVNGTAVEDGWGGAVDYVYQRASSPDSATVYSRGSNGVDDGPANEELQTTVFGAGPGIRRTRQRMRIIIESLGTYIEAGGSLTGSWATDRAALGLGVEYATDGFGSAFTLDAATRVLRSAGPDRAPGSADDLTS